MTQIAKLTEVIALTEREIRELKVQQNGLNDKRHLLAALNGRLALAVEQAEQAELRTRIANTLADIELASSARDTLAVKQASLNMLNQELDVERGTARRQQCQDVAANFDRVRAGYTEDSKALLVTFRRLYELHKEYLALTGRELLSEVDFKLELPAARNHAWVSPFSSGQEIRQ